MEENIKEIEEARNNLLSWANESNFEKADGLDDNEIFQKFGNIEFLPIAIIPEKAMGVFYPIKDNKVYSGKGYFIAHMVNHHDELQLDEYESLQDDLTNFDHVYQDPKNKSIVFEKEKKSKKYSLVLKQDVQGRIIFYKSYHYGDKTKKRFIELDYKKLYEEMKMLEKDGIPFISHSENSEPGSPRISARPNNSNIKDINHIVNSKENNFMENQKTKQIFNSETLLRNELSPEQEAIIQNVLGSIKFENAVGENSEYANIYKYFDFNNHADEFTLFLKSAKETNEIDHKNDNVSFVQHYLENKLNIPVYKDGKRTSFNWNEEEKNKYSQIISKLNLIAQGIVKSNESYNIELLKRNNALTLEQLEKTFQEVKKEQTIQKNEEIFEKSKNIDELKKELNIALKEVAKPLEIIDFTRENYNKLFPQQNIKTPIENVKLGANQFEKLEKKEREKLLKAVYDVLNNPDIIINEERQNVFNEKENAHIYGKSFVINEKFKTVQSVVIEIEGENISISSHERELNNLLNKIKMPDQLLYARAEVEQIIERITNNSLGTVNQTRENENSRLSESPVESISQTQELSNDTEKNIQIGKELSDLFETKSQSNNQLENLNIENNESIFYDIDKNPHSVEELYEVLENFSNVESENWNLSLEGKIAVTRLMNVSKIKTEEKEKTIENLKNYLLLEEYEREKFSYAKILTPILLSRKEDKTFSFEFSNKKEKDNSQEETKIIENETEEIEVENSKEIHSEEVQEKNKSSIEKEKKQTNKDLYIYGETELPEFAMLTGSGIKNFKNMVIDSRDDRTKYYLLKSKDGKDKISVDESTLQELISEPYKAKAKTYTEETKIQEKMIESQYKSFFEPRNNDANNFRHNLSVFCRKEANSPLDALKVANSLIKQMSNEEKYKTKQLLKKLCKEGQTINEVLIETYNEAIKEIPLNEDYLKNKRYEKLIARPMYDTKTSKGEKIDRDFDLKIGDTVKVQFKAKKVFGIRKENILSECKIISSSKEGNLVTLMDGKKSYYDVPRDTFLKDYGKQLVKEHQMTKKQFAKHSMKLDTGRER